MITHRLTKSGRGVISTGVAVGAGSEYVQCIIPFNESELANKRNNTKPWHMQVIRKTNLKEASASGYAG